MFREQGFTILFVEQKFRFAAREAADRHYLVEHGRVIDCRARCKPRFKTYLGV